MSYAEDFEYFVTPEVRGMIAETGFRTADYLLEQEIGSVVLVDNSARNMHVPIREAYRQLSPDTELPSIYFLNPMAFISPDVHSLTDYDKRALNLEAEKQDVSLTEMIRIAGFNPRLGVEIAQSVDRQYGFDQITDKRRMIAARMTPLVDKIIKCDPRFNGRVLVMDACSHSGASLNGITTALQDIGITEVQKGAVVSDPRERSSLDFAAFRSSETDFTCPPFGHQDGLLKGDDSSFTVKPSLEGLSKRDKLARKEIRQIMAHSDEARAEFAETQTAPFYSNEESILDNVIETLFGSNAKIISSGSGIIIASSGNSTSFEIL